MKISLLLPAAALTVIAADAPIPTPEQVVQTYAKALTRTTEKPKSISAELMTMCKSIPDDIKFGPHSRSYVHQYRNTLALEAKGNFPAGSVLVKEKMVSEGDGGKLLSKGLTGMIKQPAGTFPKSGDWLFFEVSNGKVETAKMEGCVGCHSGAKRDFVFTDVPKR